MMLLVALALCATVDAKLPIYDFFSILQTTNETCTITYCDVAPCSCNSLNSNGCPTGFTSSYSCTGCACTSTSCVQQKARALLQQVGSATVLDVSAPSGTCQNLASNICNLGIEGCTTAIVRDQSGAVVTTTSTNGTVTNFGDTNCDTCPPGCGGTASNANSLGTTTYNNGSGTQTVTPKCYCDNCIRQKSAVRTSRRSLLQQTGQRGIIQCGCAANDLACCNACYQFAENILNRDLAQCTCFPQGFIACPDRDDGSKKGLLGLLGLLGLIPLLLCLLLLLLCCCRKKKREADVHFATFDPQHGSAMAPAMGAPTLGAPPSVIPPPIA